MNRYLSIVRLLWLIVAALLVLSVLIIVASLLAGLWGLIALAGAALVLGAVLRLLRRWVPSRTILEIDFEAGVLERAPDDLLSQIGERKSLILRDVLDTLERAARDRRVVALLARIAPSRIGPAHVQEIRSAIEAFRRSGKRAVAYCQTLGEGNTATLDYYLASAFDEVHLQPMSELAMTGLISTQPFARGLLDKLGILPRIEHRKEYKSAKYLLTESEMPAPQREVTQAILDSLMQQIVEGIAPARKLDASRVRQLIDQSPLNEREALDAKLIDGISYRDEVEERLKEQFKGKLLLAHKYLARAGRPNTRGPQIAIVHGVGAIARGKSRTRRLPQQVIMGCDDIVGAFRRAIKSKKTRAIVFRIESPGGSVVASDAIWHMVLKAREVGKPVVVSMANVAGSGGYYVATHADRIVASPGTITGSIGVVFGKMITAEAWRKIGINFQSVMSGENASIWSNAHDFSDAQWAKVQRFLDEVYQRFKEKVADGRKLSSEAVEALAKGRIWTGAQARELGLVDEVGGMQRAIELAKELAKLPTAKSVTLVTYPRASIWTKLLGDSKESTDPTAKLALEAIELADPMLHPFSMLWDPPTAQARLEASPLDAGAAS